MNFWYLQEIYLSNMVKKLLDTIEKIRLNRAKDKT